MAPPALAATVVAYQASRNGLAVFLAAGSRSTANSALATREENADSHLDSDLAILPAAISARLTQAASHARDAARTARDDLLW